MTVFDPNQTLDLLVFLDSDPSADEFFSRLRDVAGRNDRERSADAQLALEFYRSSMAVVKDQTYFSIQAGRLMAKCGEYFPDSRSVDAQVRQFIASNPDKSQDLSIIFQFAYSTGHFELLTERMEGLVKQSETSRALPSDLMIAFRSLLILTDLIYTQYPSHALPVEIRPKLYETHPEGTKRTIATALEHLCDRHPTVIAARQSRPESQDDLCILFVMEDFIFDYLNTLTKLYCDYFFILSTNTTSKIVVRVFNIYRNYEGSRFPGVWDPPSGELKDLMGRYFGEKGVAAAERIDFEYVNCWQQGDDYFKVVDRVLLEAGADVAVMCIDRTRSLLQRLVFASMPLLQFELINGSGWVLFCDGLIPNGVASAERKSVFRHMEAAIPQIPFPTTVQITKSTLGFDETSYVAAVVGKNFPRRLDQERKRDFSLRFAIALDDLMTLNKSLSLLLVGEDEQHILEWFGAAGLQIDTNRVKIIEFAPDLRATMQACDLIVNPPMMGGGRGIGLAITDRLPTLIFSDTDARNFVPDSNVCVNLTDFVLKASWYIAKGSGYRENYANADGVEPFSELYNRQAAKAFVEAALIVANIGLTRLQSSIGPT